MKLAMYAHFDRLIRELGFEKAVLRAKELGFSGVELLDCAAEPENMLFKTEAEAKAAGDFLHQCDMHAVCYSVGISLYQSDAAVDSCRRHAETAALLGSPYFHHLLYPVLVPDAQSPSFEAVLADVLPRAVKIADHAKSLGLTALYEEQGAYFNGLAQFGAFFTAMRRECDNVGFCADLGNSMFVGCQPSALISAFAAEIRHVHVKDYRRLRKAPAEGACYTLGDGTFLCPALPGDGDCAVFDCLSMIQKAGYNGWYSYEAELSYPEPFLRGLKRLTAE